MTELTEKLARLHQAMSDFRRAQRSISQLEDAIGVEYGDIIDTFEQFNSANASTLDARQVDAPPVVSILKGVLENLEEKSYL
jgi:translation initiation factor 2 alpha subunit (eIF-2alpha)